ncbi:MAG: type II toxin-antitoxin system mRNA interferase toxin, RelE/StbE family [Desulfoferrobacter sp.]
MLEAVWYKGFKRSYNKRIKNKPDVRNKFWERMTVFLSDPFARELRTHKLSGKLTGLWAFSVDDDYRVIFDFTSQNQLLLIDIGTHEEVY